MVAPVVVAVASNDNDSVDYPVNVPAGTANGDLLIAVNASDWGTFAGNDVPAAFALLPTSSYDAGANAIHISIGARIANNEPASYNFPQELGASVGAILRITGHDPALVLKQIAPNNADTGRTAPSIVPNGSDDLLITVHAGEISGSGANSWTPAAGMTEHIDRQSTIWTSLLIASLQNPANPSGTKTATPLNPINNGAACTFSIKAVSSGGGGSMTESLADIQMRKLPALVGFSGSLPDMLRAYWKLNAEPAVAAIPNLSTSDYEKSAYILASGGSPSLSISDLESLYCAVKAPASTGTLADRKYVVWRDVI